MKQYLVVVGCLLAVVGAHAENFYSYGRQCAQEVAQVPAFSCMAGEVIPITVNGQTPQSYQPHMTCDKPSLLPANAKGAQGQCLPGSRALVLRDDAKAQISAICRKKVVRPGDAYWFDEINVVAHNLKSGKTCWFTAKAAEPLQVASGIDGRLVPSPTAVSWKWAYQHGEHATHESVQAWRADHTHKPQPRPEHIWQSPAAVAKENCVRCHDSGPFMYSPYIAQTGQLPGDPFGKYQPKAVGASFKWWPTPLAISTRGNTCTACHRMGNMNSCSVAMLQSTGRSDQEGASSWAQKFPQSHWMSPGNLHSKAQWDQTFTDSLQKLAACCQNPQGAGCLVSDYTQQGYREKR